MRIPAAQSWASVRFHLRTRQNSADGVSEVYAATSGFYIPSESRGASL
jgi:hypothetical protein